jgi:uncharacterized lipoprotein YajG
MPIRNLRMCLFGAAMAASVLTTGCQPASTSVQTTSQPAPSQPAPSQPASNETVVYNKWEAETHRAHKEINQRPPEEQKEYSDWRQKHPDSH